MTYSIVIPTFNGLKYLSKVIPVLLSIKDERFKELVIIDSNSNDGTLEYLKDKKCRFISLGDRPFDHGGTRTYVASLIETDIIVFLTQDALPVDNEFLNPIMTVFEEPKLGAAYGRQISYSETNIYGKHLRKFNYPDQSYFREYNDRTKYGLKTAFLSNSFACYRKEAMDKINWFDTGLLLSEDLFAGANLLMNGYKLAYIADSVVYHSHSYTLIEEFKRYFDTGAVHSMNNWFINDFGNAESEGFRFVKSEIEYITDKKGKHMFMSIIIRNVIRYMAYKIGRYYKMLPKFLIPKISMHNRWWYQNS